MLTRLEQKAMFDSIIGDIIINTQADGEGSDVTIPLEVHWGFEPRQTKFPCVVIKFRTIDKRVEYTLGDYLGERGVNREGQFGYLGDNVLEMKIKTVDYGSPNLDDFISKYDIGSYLIDRLQRLILTDWGKYIDWGHIRTEEGINWIDVSQILRLEQLYELHGSITIRKLVNYTPIEPNIKYSTALPILGIDLEVTVNE